MGRIAYGYRAEDSTSYNWGRFLFYQHSYTTGTKTKLDKYERYLLPKVTADLAANEDYYILTTKPNSETYTFSKLRLTATTDAAVDQDNETALIIGNRAGIHLTMDGNEIISKATAKTAGSLYLNTGNAGHVHIGTGGLSVGDTEYTGNTYTIVAYGPIRAVDANISAYSNSATARNIYVENTNGKVTLNLSANGNRGLYNSTKNNDDGTIGAWMLYYNEERGRQQQASTYFTGTPYVANSTYWPSMNFISSNLEEKSMGQIAYGYRASDSNVYDIGRFYFYEYSYKTNTKTRIDYTEAYRLPAVTPDLKATQYYNILTTKNLVTVGQGGTGKSSWTKNRLVWTNDTDSLTGGNHWADASHVGINMTSAPSTALGVGGGITATGSIISDRTTSTTAEAVIRAVADTTEAWVQARNTNGTISLRIATNMGVWDSVSSKWMIYSVPGETLVRIPGSLSTPQIKLSSTSAVKHLEFSRGGMNYITTPASGSVNFCLGGAELSSDNCQMSVYPNYVKIRTPLALTADCYGDARPSSGSYTGQIFFEW